MYKQAVKPIKPDASKEKTVTKEQFERMMQMLRNAYYGCGKIPDSEEGVNTWFNFLKDYAMVDLINGSEEYVRSRREYPSISDLRTYACDAREKRRDKAESDYRDGMTRYHALLKTKGHYFDFLKKDDYDKLIKLNLIDPDSGDIDFSEMHKNNLNHLFNEYEEFSW